MGYAETIRTLSDINCGLASLVSYGQMRNNGISPYYAGMGLVGNLANGLVRNEIAYGMQRMGNPWGNNINALSGYGNPYSNAIGTLGLMYANAPWMYFGCCSPYFGTMPMMFYC